uniref:Uncharacterized protein n=1 Tax=Laminaria digitata TaxID=80365 RepID=Q8LX07_9PHAE|nr:hypothetical protein [Laminaria digitata]
MLVIEQDLKPIKKFILLVIILWLVQ